MRTRKSNSTTSEVEHGSFISLVFSPYGGNGWEAERFLTELQSQTKIVGTLKPNGVFFLLVLPLSLSKFFYRRSVTKSCTPTLTGHGDAKLSQQFWLKLCFRGILGMWLLVGSSGGKEGTGRHKTVPTILTESVALKLSKNKKMDYSILISWLRGKRFSVMCKRFQNNQTWVELWF